MATASAAWSSSTDPGRACREQGHASRPHPPTPAHAIGRRPIGPTGPGRPAGTDLCHGAAQYLTSGGHDPGRRQLRRLRRSRESSSSTTRWPTSAAQGIVRPEVGQSRQLTAGRPVPAGCRPPPAARAPSSHDRGFTPLNRTRCHYWLQRPLHGRPLGSDISTHEFEQLAAVGAVVRAME